jgi:SAM-dependent methyltransferase
MYNFGVYHWQRRFRSALSVLGALIAAGMLWRTSSSRHLRVTALAVTLGATIRGERVLRHAFSPPPWVVERYKYDALAARLPFERADRILDIGCGTGRSLVGLAPHVPDSCRLLGLDVFDDRVILGNGPTLAQRNARNAGIDATPIVGDAARLPLTTDSQDIVTACRVLHDLPASDADQALREACRVCTPDGVLGVLELPITPDDDDDPEEYWRSRVSEAGFEIERVERLRRKRGDGRYVIIVATPARPDRKREKTQQDWTTS